MAYHSVPAPDPMLQTRGYGPGTGVNDFASTPGHPIDSSPLSQSLHRNTNTMSINEDDPDVIDYRRGSPGVEDDQQGPLHRTTSVASSGAGLVGGGVARNNTLQKKGSVKRKTSLRRSGSKRSIHAGGLKGTGVDGDGVGNTNSVFYTPIPTNGSPTEILANRFQAWRKFLKDLITYFKEVQASYDSRSKSLLKVANVISNTNAPSAFLTEGGINEANTILRDFHQHGLTEAGKARDIENDVVAQLNGLRADLAAKIKEIKSLSGDFKNSVDKEKEQTRKVVAHFEEALASVDGAGAIGKEDPFVVRLAVDRQVEKQIDEENYLHSAYLNLERSGRELEAIVVGEIQKAYNALASILKREADENYDVVERLRSGPIMMPKDKEWSCFVQDDPHFISPDIPVRRVEDIVYPGKTNPAAAEVRAGMLERKSKYLKSYTPGWYVLSPTHLHEFKSADRIYSQPPVMSLYLQDQKPGSHSQPGSSSHKFMLKGRQAGSMHRGHSWVFRAETYDTMVAWYDDISALTNTTGAERDAYVRKHVRSMSTGSRHGSVSGESTLEEDEADAIPYSASVAALNDSKDAMEADRPVRPQPGGRFPSDLNIMTHRDLRGAVSPSTGESSNADEVEPATYDGGAEHAMSAGTDAAAAAATAGVTAGVGGLAVGGLAAEHMHHHDGQQPDRVTPSRKAPYGGFPMMHHASSLGAGYPTAGAVTGRGFDNGSASHGDWIAPAAVGGAGGAAVGALATQQYLKHQQEQDFPPPPGEEQPAGHLANDSPVAATVVSQDSTTNRASTDVASPALSGVASTAPTTLSDDVAGAAGAPGAVLDKHTAYDTGKDGETVNARMTGNFFPAVLRHDTSVTISELHVPGGFPDAAAAGKAA